MKLYFPKSHYNKTYRGLVFPLLKPFIKNKSFTDAQRVALYGLSETDFSFTDSLEEADMAILTMAWNYYVKTKQEALALSFISQCERLNKNVFVFNAGDYGLKMPAFKHLIEFRAAGYRSGYSDNQYAIPPFIADPLKKYYQTDSVSIRPYTATPVIGFCGQANASVFNATTEVFKIVIRNLTYYTGLSKVLPQQLLSSTYLRASVLQTLQESKQVETNFILRKQYRAGVTSQKDTHKTTLEFYDNLQNSDYGVCVRGAGNFSVRLYETLAMGRIPVFVNTDCALPLEDHINWKKHVVWVDVKDRANVAQKVKEFHEALSENDFIALQLANRTLWQEKLTLGGFFNNFFNEL